MYPEDRVLVGVINRRRDLDKARYEHWYRVPEGRAGHGIHAEYLAFFLSRQFKELNGGIHYYARHTGRELVTRRDLLPEEADHPRANDVYHKLQIGELRRKDPPVLNMSKRPIVFIYTTWDRFDQAETIADLYSEADHFVDRVFHALERKGVRAKQVWEVERASDDGGAQLRVECNDGTIIASTAARGESVIPLATDAAGTAVQYSVDMILDAIKRCGGLRMQNLRLDG